MCLYYDYDVGIVIWFVDFINFFYWDVVGIWFVCFIDFLCCDVVEDFIWFFVKYEVGSCG